MSRHLAKTGILTVFLALMIAILTSCGGVRSEAEQDHSDTTEHFYPLPDTHPGYRLKTPAFRGVLGVAPMDADGIRSDRRMLFTISTRPLELRLHHYRFWADSPTKLIQFKVSEYLNHIRYATKVIRFSPGTKIDYLLRGRILKFERYVHINADHDEVLVSIEFSIIRDSTGELVVPNTVYHLREKAVRAKRRNDTIVNAVKSFNTALNKALLQFVKQTAASQYSRRIVLNAKQVKELSRKAKKTNLKKVRVKKPGKKNSKKSG